MFKFFVSMLSESDGTVSHKRWISVTIAGVLAWGIVYAICKASNASERLSLIVATMAFILVMAGVATLPQLIELWKGRNSTKTD